MTEEKDILFKDLNAQHDALCVRFYGKFDSDMKLIEDYDRTLTKEDFVRQHLEIHKQLRELQ